MKKTLRCASALPLILLFGFTSLASASHGLKKIIYTFGATTTDGSGSNAGLVADANGNLYGTSASVVGNDCCGTVFELSPPSTPGGQWTETRLHVFNGNTDGFWPQGELLLDKKGNLYGTTMAGPGGGAGTVFELSPPAVSGGAWTETNLYEFPRDGSRGASPLNSVVMDPYGNLYGVTMMGGSSLCGGSGCGVVFELSPPATHSGAWTETVLHSFNQTDGLWPLSNLIFDRTGALYGTAFGGGPGSGGGGTAFRLTRDHGVWSMETIFNFSITNSGILGPQGGVVFDHEGNLYGVASGSGSSCNCGGVFELSPPSVAGNPWQLTKLYEFESSQGADPTGSLILDKAGNLYGTANAGGILTKGSQTGYGTVFQIRPPAVSGGSWTESTLHRFGGPSSSDGSYPSGRLVMLKGKLYGTTSSGGTLGYGTVYSLVVVP